MEFITLISTLTKFLMSYGPSALGWVVSTVLGWYIVKSKSNETTQNKETQDKLLEIKDDYISKIQEMNDKLSELNKRHTEVVNEISERRVDDLKELTEDYNKLATNTLRTLDKFVVVLEVSNKFKKTSEDK